MESRIEIIYQDPDFLVINKPAGLVVHPGAANEKKTVVSWLIEHRPEINKYNWPDATRPGIVHRLDKDTSGLMVIAKNPEVLTQFQEKFQNHEIEKTYLALVFGKTDVKGEISGLIGRDPNARRQQVARSIFFDFEPGKKREAKTYYKTLSSFMHKKEDISLVEVTLDTGRMHQIRVHFKSIGHPVIGDPVYNTKPSRIISKSLSLSRQFLHAYKLEFNFKDKQFTFKTELPQDLKNILQQIGSGAKLDL